MHRKWGWGQSCLRCETVRSTRSHMSAGSTCPTNGHTLRWKRRPSSSSGPSTSYATTFWDVASLWSQTMPPDVDGKCQGLQRQGHPLVLALQDYKFEVEHRPGKEQANTDALSRRDACLWAARRDPGLLLGRGSCGNLGAQHLGQRHRQASGQVTGGRNVRDPPPPETTSSCGS